MAPGILDFGDTGERAAIVNVELTGSAQSSNRRIILAGGETQGPERGLSVVVPPMGCGKIRDDRQGCRRTGSFAKQLTLGLHQFPRLGKALPGFANDFQRFVAMSGIAAEERELHRRRPGARILPGNLGGVLVDGAEERFRLGFASLAREANGEVLAGGSKFRELGDQFAEEALFPW